MSDTEYSDIVKEITALSFEVSAAGEDADEIGQTLLDHLEHYGGIGLAANQIGIDSRVCAVDVKEPFYMVNPRIVDRDGTTPFVEACLSFPGEMLRTERSVRVVVEADNFTGPLTFGPDPDTFKAETIEDMDNDDLLESVAVQHEVDHLNGVTLHQREQGRGITFQRDEQRDYGRNEKVVITHNARDGLGTILEIIKWKHHVRVGDHVEWEVQGPAPEGKSTGIIGFTVEKDGKEPVSAFNR
jgi:peptide deformylase